jgi:hypothetical protein
MPSGTLDERVLRAKYLDWCSARLAERFMKLAPEEIYKLAQRAQQGDEAGRTGPGMAAPGENGALGSYRSLVERITATMAAELDLPAFEAWREAYEAAPERYDRELLGLWEQELTGRS